MEDWRRDARREPIIVDLDALVPKDHLLRKIEKVMDYEWLYERLDPYYCHDNGRPGTDPVDTDEVGTETLVNGIIYIDAIIFPIFGNVMLFPCFTPVSYTHLDVYKRQSLNRLRRIRSVSCAVSGDWTNHWRMRDISLRSTG